MHRKKRVSLFSKENKIVQKNLNDSETESPSGLRTDDTGSVVSFKNYQIHNDEKKDNESNLDSSVRSTSSRKGNNNNKGMHRLSEIFTKRVNFNPEKRTSVLDEELVDKDQKTKNNLNENSDLEESKISKSIDTKHLSNHKECHIRTHTASLSHSEVLINPSYFPNIKKGDIISVKIAEQGFKKSVSYSGDSTISGGGFIDHGTTENGKTSSGLLPKKRESRESHFFGRSMNRFSEISVERVKNSEKSRKNSDSFIPYEFKLNGKNNEISTNNNRTLFENEKLKPFLKGHTQPSRILTNKHRSSNEEFSKNLDNTLLSKPTWEKEVYLEVGDLKSDVAQLQMSILNTTAKNLWGSDCSGVKMIVKKIDLNNPSVIEKIQVDSLEITIKDQYVVRSDLHRLWKTLEGRALHRGQILSLQSTLRATVRQLFKDGEVERSGYIKSNTQPLFRSESSRFIIMLQVSAETREFEDDGELMASKAISFLVELFSKWERNRVNHMVTIVLFSRIIYDKEESQLIDNVQWCPELNVHYCDHYKVLVDMEARFNWLTAVPLVSKELKNCLRDILEVELPNKYRMIVGKPSRARYGNVLQAINMGVKSFSSSNLDRDLVRSGQAIVIVSPSNGVYDVPKSLLRITSERMLQLGVRVDLVCLARQPLFKPPVFCFKGSIVPSEQDLLVALQRKIHKEQTSNTNEGLSKGIVKGLPEVPTRTGNEAAAEFSKAQKSEVSQIVDPATLDPLYYDENMWVVYLKNDPGSSWHSQLEPTLLIPTRNASDGTRLQNTRNASSSGTQKYERFSMPAEIGLEFKNQLLEINPGFDSENEDAYMVQRQSQGGIWVLPGKNYHSKLENGYEIKVTYCFYPTWVYCGFYEVSVESNEKKHDFEPYFKMGKLTNTGVADFMKSQPQIDDINLEDFGFSANYESIDRTNKTNSDQTKVLNFNPKTNTNDKSNDCHESIEERKKRFLEACDSYDKAIFRNFNRKDKSLLPGESQIALRAFYSLVEKNFYQKSKSLNTDNEKSDSHGIPPSDVFSEYIGSSDKLDHKQKGSSLIRDHNNKETGKSNILKNHITDIDGEDSVNDTNGDERIFSSDSKKYHSSDSASKLVDKQNIIEKPSKDMKPKIKSLPHQINSGLRRKKNLDTLPNHGIDFDKNPKTKNISENLFISSKDKNSITYSKVDTMNPGLGRLSKIPESIKEEPISFFIHDSNSPNPNELKSPCHELSDISERNNVFETRIENNIPSIDVRKNNSTEESIHFGDELLIETGIKNENTPIHNPVNQDPEANQQHKRTFPPTPSIPSLSTTINKTGQRGSLRAQKRVGKANIFSRRISESNLVEEVKDVKTKSVKNAPDQNLSYLREQDLLPLSNSEVDLADKGNSSEILNNSRKSGLLTNFRSYSTQPKELSEPYLPSYQASKHDGDQIIKDIYPSHKNNETNVFYEIESWPSKSSQELNTEVPQNPTKNIQIKVQSSANNEKPKAYLSKSYYDDRPAYPSRTNYRNTNIRKSLLRNRLENDGAEKRYHENSAPLGFMHYTNNSQYHSDFCVNQMSSQNAHEYPTFKDKKNTEALSNPNLDEDKDLKAYIDNNTISKSISYDSHKNYILSNHLQNREINAKYLNKESFYGPKENLDSEKLLSSSVPTSQSIFNKTTPSFIESFFSKNHSNNYANERDNDGVQSSIITSNAILINKTTPKNNSSNISTSHGQQVLPGTSKSSFRKFENPLLYLQKKEVGFNESINPHSKDPRKTESMYKQRSSEVNNELVSNENNTFTIPIQKVGSFKHKDYKSEKGGSMDTVNKEIYGEIDRNFISRALTYENYITQDNTDLGHGAKSIGTSLSRVHSSVPNHHPKDEEIQRMMSKKNLDFENENENEKFSKKISKLDFLGNAILSLPHLLRSKKFEYNLVPFNELSSIIFAGNGDTKTLQKTQRMNEANQSTFNNSVMTTITNPSMDTNSTNIISTEISSQPHGDVVSNKKYTGPSSVPEIQKSVNILSSHRNLDEKPPKTHLKSTRPIISYDPCNPESTPTFPSVHNCRWSNTFPTDDSESPFTPKWISLTMPLFLPITTDFLPKDLDKFFKKYEYPINIPESTSESSLLEQTDQKISVEKSNGIENNSLDKQSKKLSFHSSKTNCDSQRLSSSIDMLINELVYQRLEQGFQIVNTSNNQSQPKGLLKSRDEYMLQTGTGFVESGGSLSSNTNVNVTNNQGNIPPRAVTKDYGPLYKHLRRINTISKTDSKTSHRISAPKVSTNVSFSKRLESLYENITLTNEPEIKEKVRNSEADNEKIEYNVIGDKNSTNKAAQNFSSSANILTDLEPNIQERSNKNSLGSKISIKTNMTEINNQNSDKENNLDISLNKPNPANKSAFNSSSNLNSSNKALENLVKPTPLNEPMQAQPYLQKVGTSNDTKLLPVLYKNGLKSDSLPKDTSIGRVLPDMLIETTPSAVCLSNGRHIQFISHPENSLIEPNQAPTVNVTRFEWSYPFKETSEEYNYKMWPRYNESGYISSKITISCNDGLDTNWNKLDHLIAGDNFDVSDGTRYLRTRYLLIPMKNLPPDAVVGSKSHPNLKDEELRILNFEKFLEQVFKSLRNETKQKMLKKMEQSSPLNDGSVKSSTSMRFASPTINKINEARTSNILSNGKNNNFDRYQQQSNTQRINNIINKNNNTSNVLNLSAQKTKFAQNRIISGSTNFTNIDSNEKISVDADTTSKDMDTPSNIDNPYGKDLKNSNNYKESSAGILSVTRNVKKLSKQNSLFIRFGKNEPRKLESITNIENKGKSSDVDITPNISSEKLVTKTKSDQTYQPPKNAGTLKVLNTEKVKHQKNGTILESGNILTSELFQIRYTTLYPVAHANWRLELSLGQRMGIHSDDYVPFSPPANQVLRNIFSVIMPNYMDNIQLSSKSPFVLLAFCLQHPACGLCLSEHKWHTVHYKGVFTGSQLINWITYNLSDITTRQQATTVGNEFLVHGLIRHCARGLPVLDGNYIYALTDVAKSIRDIDSLIGSLTTNNNSNLSPIKNQPILKEISPTISSSNRSNLGIDHQINRNVSLTAPLLAFNESKAVSKSHNLPYKENTVNNFNKINSLGVDSISKDTEKMANNPSKGFDINTISFLEGHKTGHDGIDNKIGKEYNQTRSGSISNSKTDMKAINHAHGKPVDNGSSSTKNLHDTELNIKLKDDDMLLISQEKTRNLKFTTLNSVQTTKKQEMLSQTNVSDHEMSDNGYIIVNNKDQNDERSKEKPKPKPYRSKKVRMPMQSVVLVNQEFISEKLKKHILSAQLNGPQHIFNSNIQISRGEIPFEYPVLRIEQSRTFELDLDPLNRSSRSEHALLHLDTAQNPMTCFHFSLNWLNCTPRLIYELIHSWAMFAKRCGLKLVEVPISKGTNTEGSDPFHAPKNIELALHPPPLKNIFAKDGVYAYGYSPSLNSELEFNFEEIARNKHSYTHSQLSSTEKSSFIENRSISSRISSSPSLSSAKLHLKKSKSFASFTSLKNTPRNDKEQSSELLYKNAEIFHYSGTLKDNKNNLTLPESSGDAKTPHYNNTESKTDQEFCDFDVDVDCENLPGYILEKRLKERRIHEINGKLAEVLSNLPNFLFEREFLFAHGFVLDVEADSCFPYKNLLDRIYPFFRHDFKYTQFVHRSGTIFVQISDHGKFLWTTNYLYVSHLQNSRPTALTLASAPISANLSTSASNIANSASLVSQNTSGPNINSFFTAADINQRNLMLGMQGQSLTHQPEGTNFLSAPTPLVPLTNSTAYSDNIVTGINKQTESGLGFHKNSFSGIEKSRLSNQIFSSTQNAAYNTVYTDGPGTGFGNNSPLKLPDSVMKLQLGLSSISDVPTPSSGKFESFPNVLAYSRSGQHSRNISTSSESDIESSLDTSETSESGRESDTGKRFFKRDIHIKTGDTRKSRKDKSKKSKIKVNDSVTVFDFRISGNQPELRQHQYINPKEGVLERNKYKKMFSFGWTENESVSKKKRKSNTFFENIGEQNPLFKTKNSIAPNYTKIENTLGKELAHYTPVSKTLGSSDKYVINSSDINISDLESTSNISIKRLNESLDERTDEGEIIESTENGNKVSSEEILTQPACDSQFPEIIFTDAGEFDGTSKNNSSQEGQPPSQNKENTKLGLSVMECEPAKINNKKGKSNEQRNNYRKDVTGKDKRGFGELSTITETESLKTNNLESEKTENQNSKSHSYHSKLDSFRPLKSMNPKRKSAGKCQNRVNAKISGYNLNNHKDNGAPKIVHSKYNISQASLTAAEHLAHTSTQNDFSDPDLLLKYFMLLCDDKEYLEYFFDYSISNFRSQLKLKSNNSNRNKDNEGNKKLSLKDTSEISSVPKLVHFSETPLLVDQILRSGWKLFGKEKNF
ncbi:hypothetical protein BB559_003951 [Furculomyces boomerangus]|uniref:Vacuolar membrane-associated protein IML1 n=1 Tax=Furculomyces boomerangus TaxID=61424 RepID=A0A2T9YHN7_9FUNG|nr:hypothetical protein BB559_003951 [Furculomyces boomerangus]